jgi:hypothetical protein
MLSIYPSNVDMSVLKPVLNIHKTWELLCFNVLYSTDLVLDKQIQLN